MALQEFYDRLVEAQRDVNWLATKAASSVMAANNRVFQRDVEIRRARITTMLESCPKVFELQRAAMVESSQQVETMKTDVTVAITGLRDFLASIVEMPMADETRAVVQTNLDAINATLDGPPH